MITIWPAPDRPPYAFRSDLEDAGLSPLERDHTNWNERYAGEHNDLWYAIARHGAEDFRRQHDARALGRLSLALRESGLQAGLQLADVLDGITDPNAYQVPQLAEVPKNSLIGTCSDSELSFSKFALTKGNSGGGYLVLRNNGVPILLEKNGMFGLPSLALSLAPITANETTYPPGFMFGVTHPPLTTVQRTKLPSGRMALVGDVADMVHLQPRRQSLYSIPLGERALVAEDLMGAHRGSDDVWGDDEAPSWIIDDIRALVGDCTPEPGSYAVPIHDLRHWEGTVAELAPSHLEPPTPLSINY